MVFPEAKNRNKVEKKFCNDKCRWNFHNKTRIEAFAKELAEVVTLTMVDLLKKHGFIKE